MDRLSGQFYLNFWISFELLLGKLINIVMFSFFIALCRFERAPEARIRAKNNRWTFHQDKLQPLRICNALQSITGWTTNRTQMTAWSCSIKRLGLHLNLGESSLINELFGWWRHHDAASELFKRTQTGHLFKQISIGRSACKSLMRLGHVIS